MSRKILSVFLVLILIFTAACTANTKNPSQYNAASDSDSSLQPTDITQAPDTDDGSEYRVSVEDSSYYVQQTGADNARVFYEIFVGSFSDSDGDGIGDLKGIINRMDYLNDGSDLSGKSLGVEGIWLSPIFESPSYHKYDTTDYYKVDPAFGSADDLKALVNICHERGVKLILDFVINHTGSQNAWFKDFCSAHRTGDTASEYYDFYTYNNTGSKSGRTFSKISSSEDYYECNFSGDMPELNYDNEKVYETMLEVARFYLEDIGVDGFRFDAAKYIYYGEESRNVEFWKRFVGDLKLIKPDLYTVGEVWSADTITEMYSPALNCFNFTMASTDGLISSTVKKGNVNNFTHYTECFINSLSKERSDSMPISFISNHDMDRAAGYMTLASGYAKMAANLNILSPGSPFIYYGEEIAMKGSRGSANTDANRRLAMLWGDGDTVSDPEGTTFEKAKQTNGNVTDTLPAKDSLVNYYKRLIMVRKCNPEIATGTYHAVEFEDTKLGGFMSISDSGQVVMVFHNTSGGTLSVDLRAAELSNGGKISDFADLDSLRIKEILEAGFSLDESETGLKDGILTLDAQTSVIIR